MAIEIDDIEIDEYNEREMNQHGVTVREVFQVINGRFEAFRNAKKHNAPYLVVGRTLGGRLLTIPIAPTSQPGVWRPATAFDAGPGDIGRLKEGT